MPNDWIIRRDRTAERAAADKLPTLGFRARALFAVAWAERAEALRYRAQEVPGAVRALLADGWRVEADGKLYRRPGQFHLEVTSGIDWFDLTATVDFEGVRAALPELLRALRRGENTVVLGDGSFGILPEEWLAKYGLLGEIGSVEGEKLRFRRSQAGILDAALLAADADADSRVDEMFARARAELAGSRASRRGRAAGLSRRVAPLPEAWAGMDDLLARLRLRWLPGRRHGARQDGPGLGHARASGAARSERPSLAVVPKSLVWNWQHEAARFVPSCACSSARGIGALGGACGPVGRRPGHHHLRHLRNDVDAPARVRLRLRHSRRGPGDQERGLGVGQAARLLRGDHRLALSGTPMENHVGELWSLFEFLNPGMLGSSRILQGAAGDRGPGPRWSQCSPARCDRSSCGVRRT